MDWSGAQQGERRKIWLAEVAAGILRRIEDGRNRDEIADYLIGLAGRERRLIVGLDFSFSLPEWFLTTRGLHSAVELWDLAAAEGEQWLASGAAPFWGRKGTKRPPLPAHFRGVEAALPPVGGIRPKSTFQIGGAGAVGTGSIRGMSILRKLRAAGFTVWPFDEPRPPLVIEIYPRSCTGPVNKSSGDARRHRLDQLFPALPPDVRIIAAGCDDAFDATVTALVMWQHVAQLTALPVLSGPVIQTEGAIWYPGIRFDA